MHQYRCSHCGTRSSCSSSKIRSNSLCPTCGQPLFKPFHERLHKAEMLGNIFLGVFASTIAYYSMQKSGSLLFAFCVTVILCLPILPLLWNWRRRICRSLEAVDCDDNTAS